MEKLVVGVFLTVVDLALMWVLYCVIIYGYSILFM